MWESEEAIIEPDFDEVEDYELVDYSDFEELAA